MKVMDNSLKKQDTQSIDIFNYSYSVHSHYGNDGIIEMICKYIGIKKGIFVEFGAGDGMRGSNCRKLFEEGWKGLFIECDDDRYEKLFLNYRKFSQIRVCHAKVGFEGGNLFDSIADRLLGNCVIDVCTIDINGLDLEVFETFHKYLPTIVCIEGGQALAPMHARIDRSIAAKNIQQSLSTYVEVFEKKGYKLIGCYQDCFFVKKEYYPLFNVSTDLIALYVRGFLEQLHRLPYVQDRLAQYGLSNAIVDYVLAHSNYAKYKDIGKGKEGRALWIANERGLIYSSFATAAYQYRRHVEAEVKV